MVRRAKNVRNAVATVITIQSGSSLILKGRERRSKNVKNEESQITRDSVGRFDGSSNAENIPERAVSPG